MKIQVTREQVQKQLEADIMMEKKIPSRFYSLRISQSKDILTKGHGIYSTFINEEIEVEII